MPRPAPRTLAFGLLLAAAAAWRVGSSFGGWFLQDDVLNQRWVLEYRDAPWRALAERHVLHDHVRPFNLLAHWLGAQLSDGDWWGPHVLLCLLLLGALTAAAGLAAERAPAGLGLRAAGLTGALALALPGVERLLTWNAWMGSAGELACGYGAVLTAALARRTGRPGGVLAAAALVVAAGLFKEPGWLVYPAGVLALVAPDLRAGRRDPVTLGLAALPLLGLAGLAFTWHGANAVHYAQGGPGTFGANLLTAAGSIVGAWPVVGAAAGLAPPLLLLLRGPVRPVPVELVLLLASVGVMLPNPDFHVVHVLPGALALAVWVGRALAARLDGLPRPLLLGLAAWQLVLLAGNLRPSPPVPAEAALRERLLPLVALADALDARALVVPPEAQAEGGGAYQRQATALLAPLWGVDVRTTPGDGPPALIAATDAGRLLIQPGAERRLVDGNVLARHGVRLDPGRTVAADVPAGTWVLGALFRGPGADGPDLAADDACGGHWEVRREDPTVPLVLTPLALAPACRPLRLGVDRPLGPDVLVFLSPLAEVRPHLRGAPSVERRLDVTARGPTPSLLPSFEVHEGR